MLITASASEPREWGLIWPHLVRPYLRLDVIDGADSGLSPEASVQATWALLVRPGEFAKSPSQPWYGGARHAVPDSPWQTPKEVHAPRFTLQGSHSCCTGYPSALRHASQAPPEIAQRACQLGQNSRLVRNLLVVLSESHWYFWRPSTGWGGGLPPPIHIIISHPFSSHSA